MRYYILSGLCALAVLFLVLGHFHRPSSHIGEIVGTVVAVRQSSMSATDWELIATQGTPASVGTDLRWFAVSINDPALVTAARAAMLSQHPAHMTYHRQLFGAALDTITILP